MKQQIKYNNLIFDSNEELMMYYFLEELLVNKYINSFDYHPESIGLSDLVKYKWYNKTNITKEFTLLREHIYTYDYEIVWNINKSHNIFYNNINDNIKLDKIPFITQNDISKIEIKPAWDAQNMTRLFSINQKWLYQKYDIYVQKIIPIGDNKCLFAKTFTPKEALYTAKQRKLKKYKFKTRSLEEFLEAINEQK